MCSILSNANAGSTEESEHGVPETGAGKVLGEEGPCHRTQPISSITMGDVQRADIMTLSLMPATVQGGSAGITG